MKLKPNKVLLREAAKIFTNGLFYKNPILIGALGLFPVVAAGYNVRMAVELSLIFLLIATPVELILCGIGGLLPAWARPGVVLCISAVCYLPAVWLTDKIMPGSLNALGIYAGLMICNSMILSRANEYAPFHILWAVLADVLGCFCGFTILICGVSAIREYLQRGSVGNFRVGSYAVAEKGMALPFFGFILVGFAAALVQWINNRRMEKAAKRKVTQT